MDQEREKRRNQCNIMLKALLGENNFQQWWNSKNKAFDDKTPEEVWVEDSEKVFDYLVFYCLR